VNAGRDVERLIADWLVEEAASGAPDRALDAVRFSVDRTRQRRFLAAWRDDMSTSMTRLAAVAAAIVVAVGAVAWFAGSRGPSIGGVPTPGPTVTSPAPSPTAGPGSTTAVVLQGAGPFDPGTYLIGAPFLFDVTIRFPATGWTLWGGPILSGVAPFYKISPDPPGLGLIFVEVENVYANPCNTGERLLDPPLGPTVDDLVTALANQPFTDATAATDVTISGYSGKHLEYTFTGEDPACTALARWPSQLGDRQAMAAEHDELWILDVDGRRLVIDLFSFRATSAAELAEARAIVEGLVIKPRP
jgi:hypothetical protein